MTKTAKTNRPAKHLAYNSTTRRYEQVPAGLGEVIAYWSQELGRYVTIPEN
jgi:hypothetical protein